MKEKKAKDLFVPSGPCTNLLLRLASGELTAEETRLEIINELNKYFCGASGVMVRFSHEPTFPD